MKKLGLLLLVLLAGCSNSPKFKVGDCFTFRSDLIHHYERWEKVYPAEGVSKVLELGERAYRVKEIFLGQLMQINTSSFEYDSIMVKVDCPKELK